jgi:two-component system, chemotaxis family, protein-glutamate methylesterase/glutaminase
VSDERTESLIRVLVVDDSAFARKVIREVLTRDPAIEVVGIARDGLEALEKIAELKPDVVTLDLVMPDLDGLGVLKALPKEGAPKVIVVSISGADTELGLEALDWGAVDIVTKPTPLPTDRLYDLSPGLIVKVKSAATAKPRITANSTEENSPRIPLPSHPPSTRLVVIGTSTGGPQALTELFKHLPAGLPVPVAIALHIPAGYTAPLAERVSKISGVQIDEATNGMELVAGRGVIAPGGMHLRVFAREGKLFAGVSLEPVESIYHPSVDILFESAAEAVGNGALGVVLTGMGSDGLIGSQAIKAVGGRVLAESASSCVVYGMPRTVIEAGCTEAEAPLGKFPKLLIDYIYGESPRPTLL